MAHHPTAPHVTLHQDSGGSRSVVSLLGEHDVVTAARVRDVLLAATGRSVVIDLERCSFLDGSIVGLLIGAQARVLRTGASLTVVNATGEALRPLLVLGRTHRLNVYQPGGERVTPSLHEAA